MDQETPAKSRAPNRRIDQDTVSDLMSEIIEMITTELGKQKEVNNYSNLRFYKELLQKTKVLEHDVLKLLKQKRVVKRRGTSIFKKEVPVTSELAKFLELPKSSISRAECTRKLHAYILKTKLQNEENKKEILPDAALAKLLDYDPLMNGPLYYTTVQKLIQKHFVKQE